STALGAFAGGPAFAAAAAAAFTSSPSWASTAMSWLTGTSLVPSGTRILANVPSSMASYSIVALSVSISAITSPVLTASPSFLSHFARLPFSIVGDSAGIRILTGMARQFHRKELSVANHLGRLDDFGDRRQRELFQICGIRHRHVLAADAGYGSVEIIERVFHYARGNLSADAGLLPA